MKNSLMSTNSITAILIVYTVIFWLLFGISFISSMPINSAGNTLDWKAMSVRNTSKNVVTQTAIEQNSEQFHPMSNNLIDEALPLVTSVYAGIAEHVDSITLHMRKGRGRNKKHKPQIIEKLDGEVEELQAELKTLKEKVSPMENVVKSELSAYKSSLASNCFTFLNQALTHISDKKQNQ